MRRQAHPNPHAKRAATSRPSQSASARPGKEVVGMDRTGVIDAVPVSMVTTLR